MIVFPKCRSEDLNEAPGTQFQPAMAKVTLANNIGATMIRYVGLNFDLMDMSVPPASKKATARFPSGNLNS